MKVVKADGKVNKADLGTKPHTVSEHLRLCEAVGLNDTADLESIKNVTMTEKKRGTRRTSA